MTILGKSYELCKHTVQSALPETIAPSDDIKKRYEFPNSNSNSKYKESLLGGQAVPVQILRSTRIFF